MSEPDPAYNQLSESKKFNLLYNKKKNHYNLLYLIKSIKSQSALKPIFTKSYESSSARMQNIAQIKVWHEANPELIFVCFY